MVEIINNDLQSTATYYQSIQNHFSYRLRQIIVIELNNAEERIAMVYISASLDLFGTAYPCYRTPTQSSSAIQW